MYKQKTVRWYKKKVILECVLEKKKNKNNKGAYWICKYFVYTH